MKIRFNIGWRYRSIGSHQHASPDEMFDFIGLVYIRISGKSVRNDIMYKLPRTSEHFRRPLFISHNGHRARASVH